MTRNDMTRNDMARRATGRPRKFQEPSRPVTVTLPESALAKLEAVDPDRARAIVKCVAATIRGNDGKREPVEEVEVLPGKALIVVGPSRSLARIPWLRRVEIAPARFLLVLPAGTSVESLEVEIHDLMNTIAPTDSGERELLEKLRGVLAYHRRQHGISKAELVFVDVSRH